MGWSSYSRVWTPGPLPSLCSLTPLTLPMPLDWFAPVHKACGEPGRAGLREAKGRGWCREYPGGGPSPALMGHPLTLRGGRSWALCWGNVGTFTAWGSSLGWEVSAQGCRVPSWLWGSSGGWGVWCRLGTRVHTALTGPARSVVLKCPELCWSLPGRSYVPASLFLPATLSGPR